MPPIVKNITIPGHISIETTVTGESFEVDQFLRDFYSRKRTLRNSVIGLSTEWTKTRETTKSRIALLQLCDGEQCLIVQLRDLISLPTSLFNFLGLLEVVFIGIGIQKSVERLERDYSVCVKNAVELGALTKPDQMRGWGYSGGLFRGTIGLLTQKTSSVIFDDWGVQHLSDDQIGCATRNSYYFYKIGSQLIWYRE